MRTERGRPLLSFNIPEGRLEESKGRIKGGLVRTKGGPSKASGKKERNGTPLREGNAGSTSSKTEREEEKENIVYDAGEKTLVSGREGVWGSFCTLPYRCWVRRSWNSKMKNKEECSLDSCQGKYLKQCEEKEKKAKWKVESCCPNMEVGMCPAGREEGRGKRRKRNLPPTIGRLSSRMSKVVKGRGIGTRYRGNEYSP